MAVRYFFPVTFHHRSLLVIAGYLPHAGRLGFAAVVGEGGACVLALLSVSKGGKAFFCAFLDRLVFDDSGFGYCPFDISRRF
jgi:hypothetical protein